jgi:hypothetical protein
MVAEASATIKRLLSSVSKLSVTACDKREAFAQGSASDEAIRKFLAGDRIASLRSQ